MMHREERKIYFSNQELFKALAFFCETTNLNFPFDDKAKLSFHNETELIATLCDPDQSDVTREFLESEIAVALILLCKKLYIPIARKAEKSVEVLQDNVVLIMRISSENAAI